MLHFREKILKKKKTAGRDLRREKGRSQQSIRLSKIMMACTSLLAVGGIRQSQMADFD